MTPAIAFINHVLTQQAWARDKLKPYAGRSVRVQALPLDFKLTITPAGLVAAGLPVSSVKNGSHQGSQGNALNEMRDEPQPEPRASVTLSVPLSVAPMFAIDPERAMKEVRIEGDAEFAQTLSQLARELRWDAEEDLSRVTGDIAAHKLMQGLRTFQEYAKDASQRFTETGAAFLIDEAPTLVRKSVAEAFVRDVSTLRDDAARLEKRLELLEAKHQR
jgi:ubiquinone biosynthesis accessory factor UbiJ